MRCGNKFISATYTPEPDDDAGDADHPLSSGTVSPERSKSCRTETVCLWQDRISPVAPVGQPTPDRTVYELGIALLFGHRDVASGRNCVELIPLVTWFAVSWGQLVLGAGIGPQWEPLCVIGVPWRVC